MSKKTLLIIFKISFLVILGLGVYSFVHSQQVLLGNGNITQRDQWTSTSTPVNAITQSTYGKSVKLSGLVDGCLNLVSGVIDSSGSACGAGTINGTGFAGMMASWLDSTTLIATSTIVGSHFIATSSTSSRFPYASTTVISVSGDSYFTGVIRNVGGSILGYAQGSSGALTTYPSSVTQTDAFKVFGNNGVSAYVERFKVTSAGNVGIGTTSPYAKLSVVGPVVAEYFNATSTTATSTFAGDITQGLGKILTTHSVRSDASDGVLLQANNYTNVGLFGAGNTSNSLFYGGVNIDGATRLATSLSGCVRALLGVISASGTCAPYPFTPTTNYAVNNQATTGIMWFQNGLNASTTSRFVHTNAGSLVIGADVNTGDFVQYSDTFDRNVVNAINWTVTGTNFTQYGVMGGRGNGASWSANGFTGTQPYRRNNTLTFMADVTPGTSADFMIGLSSSPSSLNFTNMPHAIRFISSNTTNVYENGTDRGSVSASWVASTTYRVKIVVNPTGAIYYRSSNGGDTWTKLYNGTANNITTTPLYPSLTAVGTGFLHVDNVSISNGFDVLTASQFVPKNFTVGEGDLLVNGGKVTVATTSATSTFAGGVAFSRSVTMATTNGNVGINTATPSQKLDVVGTIQGSNFNGNVNASSTFTGLISGAVGANLTLNVNTANNLILNPSGAKVGIGGTPAFNLDVFSPVTGISVDNVMRITSAARFVGNTVNATYPGGLGQANFIFQKLGVQTWSIGSDFAADGTKDFFFYDNTNLNNPLYVSNTGDLRLGSAGTAATGGYNGTQRATLKADTGNFGIGNTAPTFKLDVTGNGRFTSLVDASHFVATSTTATSTFAGKVQAASYSGSNGTPGFSGTCTLASITTITVEDGLITACN